MIKKILYHPRAKKILSSILGRNLYIKLASLSNSVIFIFFKKMVFDLGIAFTFKSLPTYVALEINAYCNRKCVYCPNYKYGQRSDNNSIMSESVFYKVINELARLQYHRTVYYHLYNEPLTDKRLPGFVEYTRLKLPKTTIDIYTNGDYLDYSLYSLLINKGVDRFLIAIHGENASPKLLEALNKLSEKEKKAYIILKNTYDDYRNKKDIFFNRGGSINISERVSDSKPCEYVLSCNIDYKGNVILCCNDYFGKYIFGNVKEQPLHDIWFNKEYMILRNRIALGYRELPICKKCDI